jgi:hypothetical protein
MAPYPAGAMTCRIGGNGGCNGGLPPCQATWGHTVVATSYGLHTANSRGHKPGCGLTAPYLLSGIVGQLAISLPVSRVGRVRFAPASYPPLDAALRDWPLRQSRKCTVPDFVESVGWVFARAMIGPQSRGDVRDHQR